MKKLSYLLLLALTPVFANPAVNNGTTPMSSVATKTVTELANDYATQYFTYFPELALFWGKTKVPQNKFSNHSYQNELNWQALQDQWLTELSLIDETKLINSSEHTTFQLLKESLENAKATRICKETLWNVNPLRGWHIELGVISSKQPLDTPQERKQALERWATVPQLVKDEINNLKLGLTQGYTAPKPVVERVIKQLDLMIPSEIEASPFYAMADRAHDTAFRKKFSEIIKLKINPAIKEFRDFLESEYLPKARTEIGLSALPNGEACYLAKIKESTTLTIDPKAIYSFGENHMSALEKEIAQIGLSEFNTLDTSTIFQKAIQSSHNYFQTEADILSYNTKALERARAKLPQWFHTLPKAACIVTPYPMHRAKTGAAGEYHPATEDGKSPAMFYINAYDPPNKSRVDQEATLFHELLPGHHLQVALAQEEKSHHPVDSYLWNAGFGEGWALYSERLANEMDLYNDNISKLGMLSNEALRTARLVVDPGIHVFGWTRQQAIDFMRKHTALDRNVIEGEVDRYIMMPGQATSYMLGKREIDTLREYSKSILKENFDIRDFHDQVLKHGAVTLPMLRANIMSWLETERKA
ncbi:MAG: DUF885 family protein [Candidatus Berkiella sp.]